MVGDKWETQWRELLTWAEGERRGKGYEKVKEFGCYMFFIRGGRIDAINEPPIPLRKRVGRLINHSKGYANVVAEMHMVNGTPKIIFQAKNDIREADVSDYEYIDMSKCDAINWLDIKRKNIGNLLHLILLQSYHS